MEFHEICILTKDRIKHTNIKNKVCKSYVKVIRPENDINLNRCLPMFNPCIRLKLLVVTFVDILASFPNSND